MTGKTKNKKLTSKNQENKSTETAYNGGTNSLSTLDLFKDIKGNIEILGRERSNRICRIEKVQQLK